MSNDHCDGVAPCRWEREHDRVHSLIVEAFGELQAAIGNPRRAVDYAKRAMRVLDRAGASRQGTGGGSEP